MAYTNPWNPASPAGTDPASSIDDRIREIKLALNERLDQVIANFSNDGVDPKTLIGGGATVGNTPAGSTSQGAIHYENDDGIISVGVGSTFRPGSAGAWRIDYDDSLSVGSKGSNANQRMRMLVISCTKIKTDGSGFMQIDLGEVNTKIQAVNSGTNTFTVANGRVVVATPEDPNTDIICTLARFTGTGIQLGFYNAATGLPLASYTSAGALGVNVIAYFAA